MPRLLSNSCSILTDLQSLLLLLRDVRPLAHLPATARDPHHQVVQDTTPASKVPPSVVLTPPDLSSTPMSPIAGWVEAPPTEGNNQDVPNLHASSKTPVPRDFQRSSSSSSTGDSNSHFFSYEAQPSRRSAGPRPVSSCGDGEQIDDFIGRPQSPEDVKRARPSRETVAIGSRQATLRHRRQSERSKAAAAAAAAAAADARQEWDDSSRTKTPTAAAALDAAPPPAIGDETLPASAPATVVSSSQEQDQDQDQEGQQQELGIEPASGQASASSAVAPAPASAPAAHAPSTLLTSPQPRRAALHFFGRRREASQSSVGSTGEDVLERLADTPTQSGKAKKDSNVASPAGGGFWRLGGKKTAKDDRPSSSAGKQARPSSAGSAPPAALPASATALSSGEVENKEPSPALSRRNSTQVGKPDNKDSSSAAKLCKGKARRLGALGADMQPMMVKVRAKNKSSKDRDFGRLFLAQELALGGADGSSTPKPRPVSSSGLPSVAASSSPNPSSNTDDAKLPNVESMGSVSSATSSNLSAPNSTSAHKRKKATWAMKFSLDGKHLAVAVSPARGGTTTTCRSRTLY
ncbi:hypothetical protein FA10DRAFT_183492 [Acaromyces ingoldii]|uniref:Uncharacterized protein n=1 Tax=Acaromyces ingoldii TaxID=215250 RepID=A0A316YCW9_9BASI|nr:hypothetical protein FA10DRAFT_183492 [Acaromyces ingoldii]PWN87356.1 hypothetical protein FA10DRAFT_183492 [Acaromyces ingoldii]